ncbi:MAG: hypothetical protein ACREEL_00055 [Stellaceae bacterium]
MDYPQTERPGGKAGALKDSCSINGDADYTAAAGGCKRLAADARLLRAIADVLGADTFDQYHVAVEAPRHPGLLCALSFLSPTIDRRHATLSRRTTAVVARWLHGMLDRDVDGLRLECDRVGWFHIEGGNVVAGPLGLSP